MRASSALVGELRRDMPERGENTDDAVAPNGLQLQPRLAGGVELHPLI